MRLVEYRIFMPLTLDENLIGQIWSFAEVSRVNTGGGEGVEILENTLFDLPKDDTGRIVYKNLPDYEDYETQKANSKNPIKKNTSKENFGLKRQTESIEKSMNTKTTTTTASTAVTSGEASLPVAPDEV